MSNETPGACPICNGNFQCQCEPEEFWQKIRELQAELAKKDYDYQGLEHSFDELRSGCCGLTKERDELINTNCETKHELVTAEQTITELRQKYDELHTFLTHPKTFYAYQAENIELKQKLADATWRPIDSFTGDKDNQTVVDKTDPVILYFDFETGTITHWMKLPEAK